MGDSTVDFADGKVVEKSDYSMPDGSVLGKF
jgi:hypothetical protein